MTRSETELAAVAVGVLLLFVWPALRALVLFVATVATGVWLIRDAMQRGHNGERGTTRVRAELLGGLLLLVAAIPVAILVA